MNDTWHLLGMALALWMVFEGILPFLNPQAFRRLMLAMIAQDDRTLRIQALLLMLSGLGLMHLIN